MLEYYLDHQKEVVTRRTKFDLNKAEDNSEDDDDVLRRSDDDYEDNYESFVLFFNHFSIDTNKTLNFGTLTKGDSLAFDILKQIITSIEL